MYNNSFNLELTGNDPESQNSFSIFESKDDHINLEESQNECKQIFNDKNSEERPTSGISNDGHTENKNLKKPRKFLNKKRKKQSFITFTNKIEEEEKEIIIAIPGNKKKPGRKTKMNPNIDHTKFADDNIRRKCKHFVLKNLLKCINYNIQNIYDGNIGIGIFKKELQTIKQSQKSDATINFNKDFLKKTIGEIFSENISTRYTIYPQDHNKNIIAFLMNEEDENKKRYFTKLFNLNFKECLNHFIGKEKIDELQGMKCFSEIKDDILKKYPKDGDTYCENLEYYLNNYEVIIEQKKARKPRKNKENNSLI